MLLTFQLLLGDLIGGVYVRGTTHFRIKHSNTFEVCQISRETTLSHTKMSGVQVFESSTSIVSRSYIHQHIDSKFVRYLKLMTCTFYSPHPLSKGS